jgi:hypothetical protein
MDEAYYWPKPLADHGLLLPGGQAPGWSGRLAARHVIQRERPQPFPGLSRPASAGPRAVAGRS